MNLLLPWTVAGLGAGLKMFDRELLARKLEDAYGQEGRNLLERADYRAVLGAFFLVGCTLAGPLLWLLVLLDVVGPVVRRVTYWRLERETHRRYAAGERWGTPDHGCCCMPCIRKRA